MEAKIAGIITQYEDNTFGIWSGELSVEDAIAINDILKKYQTEGCSVRGSLDELNLADVL